MLKIILLQLLLLFHCCHAEYKYPLSICVIFQNDAPYLKEWIEFHKLLGVTHFYCYNHSSTDDYLPVLKPYIQDGSVELKDILTSADNLETFHWTQCKCYTDCLIQARGVSQWVAFIDSDEFLLPIQEQPLTDFLKKYENFGGVAVNWLMFGTSHVKKLPQNSLLIESLTLCSEKNFACNRYVKSLVRPERASHFDDPHQPVYLEGYFGVNTDKLPFEGKKSQYIVTNQLRINHYWTRDEEFFYKIKIPRQIKWGGQPDPQLILQKMNAQKDDLILRYVSKLKKNMG